MPMIRVCYVFAMSEDRRRVSVRMEAVECYAYRGVLDLLRQVLTIRVQERALRAHYPVPRPACGLWPRCRVCGRFSSGLCCFFTGLLYLTACSSCLSYFTGFVSLSAFSSALRHPPNVIHRQEHRSWTGHRPSSGASRRRSALSVQSEGRRQSHSRGERGQRRLCRRLSTGALSLLSAFRRQLCNPAQVVLESGLRLLGSSTRCSELKAYPRLPTFFFVFSMRQPSRRIASSIVPMA